MKEDKVGIEASIKEFVDKTGTCNLAEIQKVLKSGEGSQEITLGAALGMLCSLADREKELSDERVRVPLDAIAKLDRTLAEYTLYSLAESSRNMKIKIETVRRLGRVAVSKKSHELLCKVAKEGLLDSSKDKKDAYSSLIKEAALLSLADVPKAFDSDINVIVDVLRSESHTEAETTNVFKAACQALTKHARTVDLDNIIDLGKNCSNRDMVLPILKTCVNFASKELLNKRTEIIPLFIKAMYAVEKEVKPPEEFFKLAKRLCCDELVKEISGKYKGDCLNSGRGLISATVLEEYPGVDEVLADAYLAFAQTEINANKKGKCVEGLIKCARANMVEKVIRKLVSDYHLPGYSRIQCCPR